MALEKARNGKFTHRLSDKANPAQKYPVPQGVLDDPNWRRITDIAEYKKLFATKEWKILPEFKEYAVFIHKSHSIFAVLPEFKKIASDIVDLLTADEKLNIIESLDIKLVDLKKLSIYQLVEIGKDFDIDIDIDIKKGKATIKNRPVVAKKVTVKKTDSAKDLTKKELLKLDLYQLNDLCTTKGIDTKGTTRKDGLINLLLGGK